MAPSEPTKRSSAARGGLAGFGVAAFAIVCCGAFSLLAAVGGSVAVGTILGIGAAVAVAAVLVAMAVWRLRRARRCASTRPSAAYERLPEGLPHEKKVAP